MKITPTLDRYLGFFKRLIIRDDKMMMKVICIVPALFVFGCGWMMTSAANRLTNQLSQAILDNNDLKTVEDGAPAYLLMIDSFIRSDPENKKLLLSGASLYAAYASVFVEDKERSKKMTDKSLQYAFQALSVSMSRGVQLRELSFDEFTKTIETISLSNIDVLFTLGVCWTGWIRAHRDDWNAVADISKVEVLMKRVVLLNEKWEDGAAYLYLGALATIIPPALGGKPDIGKSYFEKALALSSEKNLMIKVIYAQQYARLVFDRPLHDRLLNEVLASKTDVPGYTLMNTLAKKQAKELLDSADDYF